jgi:hypothetical protein
MNRLSLYLLAAAVGVSAGWWLVIGPYMHPVIADTRVELSGAHSYTMKLSPRFSYNYNVNVVFERRVSRHVFACLVGGLNQNAEKETGCGSTSPVLNLGWSIFSLNGKLLARGKYDGQFGFVHDQTDFILPVGVTYLESGKTYVLNVAVFASAGQLATLSPHISVSATTDYSDVPAVITTLVLIVVAGLLIGAVTSYLLSRRNPSSQIVHDKE